MSKLRAPNILVSLDGFATGDGQSTEAAFGHASEEFRTWFGKARLWRGLGQEESLGPDEALALGHDIGFGAEIMGRHKFRPVTGPWPADDWIGWWGEEPPFRMPCFVMTHWEREPLSLGSTTYHFVSGTPAEVLELARKAAGGLDVRLGGGPTTVNEFLAAGLVDFLHVIVAPIVLGRGVRLWDGLEGLQRRYSVESVTAPSGVTHVYFTRDTQS